MKNKTVWVGYIIVQTFAHLQKHIGLHNVFQASNISPDILA